VNFAEILSKISRMTEILRAKRVLFGGGERYLDCSLESLQICSELPKTISAGRLRKRDCFQFQVKDAGTDLTHVCASVFIAVQIILARADLNLTLTPAWHFFFVLYCNHQTQQYSFFVNLNGFS